MRDNKRGLLLLLSSVILSGCGGGSSPPPAAVAPPPPPPPPPAAETVGPVDCVNGMAGNFPCNGINLAKRIPLDDMGAASGNDIWGWTDPSDGTEYALMGLDNGVAFVRISDPENPVIAGTLPTQTLASAWRDMKVHDNHVFVVADNAGDHGMQVFDLTRLRGNNANTAFTPDAVYSQVGHAHNIAINEDSGFAYIVGTDSCNGGLHMVDISSPKSPVFAGCFGADGDTHDAQCVNYNGPDPDHAGAEICFGSNEDKVSIADVTDKSAAVSLATLTYPNLGFVHQNWVDDSHQFLIVGDETDETTFRVRTSSIVIDVRDLDNPVYLYTHQLNNNAIDHNLYVKGSMIYQANYHSGLQILEFTDLSTDTITENRFFDSYPIDNETGFDGAWSVYPFFASGILIVSDTDRGLFILEPQ